MWHKLRERGSDDITSTSPNTNADAEYGSQDRSYTSAIMNGTLGAETTTSPVKDLVVWHWNCNGYARKKAVLHQHLKTVDRKPDVIMLQESNATETPKLTGYRAFNKPSDACELPKGKGRGVCIFVRRGITFIEHEVMGKSTIEHCTVEVIVGKKRQKESVFLVNVYSKPDHHHQRFKELFSRACRLAGIMS